MTELRGLYGVGPKTGYKWLDRSLRDGPAGLEERSRKPGSSPGNDIRPGAVTFVMRQQDLKIHRELRHRRRNVE